MAKKNIDFSSEIENFFQLNKSISANFVENVILFLSAKVADHNNKHPNFKVSLSQLKEVYKRGVSDAVRLDKPTGLWAIARVNMFARFVRGCNTLASYKKLDRDVINDQSFFIDDGIRDDVIFTYEQISESKFESESFNLNINEDYSFVDLEEYSEANFPKVLKESDMVKDEALKNKDIPKYKSEEKKKKKGKILEEINTKYKKED